METRPIEIRVQGAGFDDEAFPLGVIRVSTDRSVTYLNRAITEMLGDELKLGMRVSDLQLAPESREALESAIEERFVEHRGSGYALTVNRKDLDTVVRARVAAVPEYEANGKLKGSIGFVVDESLDVAATAIYREMEQATEPTGLLCALANILRSVMPFDSFMVTALGKDQLHLRRLFETPEPPPLSSPYRWWPMPAFVQTMMRDLQPGPMDLDVLYEDPDFARLSETNAAAKAFRKRNFRHTLRLSVRSRGLQVAVITLLRLRGKPAFTKTDLRTCQRLPVIESVSWSMALDEQLQHRFAIELIARLTKVGDHALDVAQTLVDQLWEHFKWEHVSLFRVVEDRDQVRLVCQARHETRRLPENFEQPLTRGVLGRCARTGLAVNVGDVSKDPDYRVGIDGIKSELVMPLPGPKVRWLLNIESSMLDAFAEEEQHAVEMLLRVTAFVLERSAALELHAAIMDNVGDAVILTNEWNTIREVNEASTRLLGHAREEMIGQDLASFLAVTTVAAVPSVNSEAEEPQPWLEAPAGIAALDGKASRLIQSDMRASEVIRFARKDGTTISMLVSTATIPGEFGGKVFIASDLSGKQYLDRVGKLMPVFRQLASEIRVPLALAATFLEDCHEDAELDARTIDSLDKAITQIRKADLSVERVMRAAGATENVMLERTTFELGRILQHVERYLPLEKRRGLRVKTSDSSPVFVNAAYPELLFCVESLLALLLRSQAKDELIDVQAGRWGKGNRAFIALRVDAPETHSRRSGPEVESRSAAEMVMIEAVVPTLMERMDGAYVAPSGGDSKYTLLVSLAE